LCGRLRFQLKVNYFTINRQSTGENISIKIKTITTTKRHLKYSSKSMVNNIRISQLFKLILNSNWQIL